MTALSQQRWIPPPAMAAGSNPAHDTGPAALPFGYVPVPLRASCPYP